MSRQILTWSTSLFSTALLVMAEQPSTISSRKYWFKLSSHSGSECGVFCVLGLVGGKASTVEANCSGCLETVSAQSCWGREGGPLPCWGLERDPFPFWACEGEPLPCWKVEEAFARTCLPVPIVSWLAWPKDSSESEKDTSTHSKEI